MHNIQKNQQKQRTQTQWVGRRRRRLCSLFLNTVYFISEIPYIFHIYSTHIYIYIYIYTKYFPCIFLRCFLIYSIQPSCRKAVFEMDSKKQKVRRRSIFGCKGTFQTMRSGKQISTPLEISAMVVTNFDSVITK